MLAMQKKAFALTFLLALVGELYRFHGVLLLDLWVPIFVASAFVWAAFKGKRFKLTDTFIPATLFVGIGFSSLLINSTEMSQGEFMEAAFYGVRWASYFLLSVLVSWESEASKKEILGQFVVFSVALAVLGFIQLQVVPDFAAYEELGWDPHQGRLLSTWFDPNLLGGFLAFASCIVVALFLEKKKNTTRSLLLFSLGLLLLAVALTLSRSAYLGLAAGFLLIALLRSWKLLLIMGAAALLLFFISPEIQSRVKDLGGSIESVFEESYTLPDASARLRFGSWEAAWELFVQKPLLGHGYNAYSYASLNSGTIKDTEVHSASGSDSSLLTILATTGLLGFFPFLSIYIILFIQAWRARKTALGLGFLGGLATLFVHSIFVNSLLFPLLMAPFWIIAGLLPKPQKLR